MGSWWSSPAVPRIPCLRVHNPSEVGLALWVDHGGLCGPICRVDGGSTTKAKLPGHLQTHSTLRFVATLEAHGTPLHGRQLAVWSQAAACLASGHLKIQIGPHVAGDDSRVMCEQGGYALTLRTLMALVRMQQAIKERTRRRLNLAKAAHKLKQKVHAKRIQRAARAHLDKHMIECPVCLDDVPWTKTKRCCKANRDRADRMCEPCLRQYIDLELAEGKLFVRCPALGCKTTYLPEELRKMASPAAVTTYESNLAGRHVQRLADESDAGFLAFCGEHARRCPACQVLIYRYEGCDHMRCRCGRTFSWNDPAVKIDLAPRVAPAA